MSAIKSLTSDKEFEYEFLKSFKRRRLDQKFFYREFGAALYYESPHPIDDFTAEDFYIEIQGKINKNSRVAFIGMGCGDAKMELDVYNLLLKGGYNVDFYGVDSSIDMLNMATENALKRNLKIKLIYSDVNSIDFQNELTQLTNGHYDHRIFSLFGGTAGNMVQTEIIDTLYNLVQEKDIVWLDILTDESNSQVTHLKNFKRYRERLHDASEMEFYLAPLRELGVSSEDGTMGLENKYDPVSGTQSLRFFFRIKQKCTCDVIGQQIILLPGEEMKLMTIRIFHTPTLIEYFKEHSFSLHGAAKKGQNTQLLFTRTT